MTDRSAFFTFISDKLGDSECCTQLYDGLRAGVQVAGTLHHAGMNEGDQPGLGDQLVNILVQAHSQGVDLGSEVMDAMAKRINAKSS